MQPQKIATTVAFLLLGLFSSNGYSQEQFLEEKVSSLLLDEINKLRQENELKPFNQNEILDAVAFDQAEYILEFGRITHEQEQEKKKTLLNRILYYEGLFANAGENAVIVGIDSKEEVELGKPKIYIKTELNAAKAAVTSWLKDKETKLNLLDPDFYEIGISVIIDENKEVTFVVVTASLPFIPPNEKKPQTNFYGIKPYSDEACKKFLEEHPTLPQLFSDAIKVEGDQVYFEYHSLAFMEELFSTSSDGIAVDIILDQQYKCNEGNRLFPSEVNDGYLLAPAKRGKFNAYNSLREKGEVKVSLGFLPNFYSEGKMEFNGVIIKDGHYCQTIPYNRVITKSFEWFRLPYLLAGDSESDEFSWNDSSLFQIQMKEGDWKKELVEKLNYLKEINLDFSEVNVSVSKSPIENSELKEEEIRKILSENGILDFNISSSVDWAAYNKFQKGTFHQLETQGKDTSEIIEYLKSQDEKVLVNFLDSLNQLQLLVKGKANIKDDLSTATQIELFNNLKNNQKIEAASFIQVKLIKAILDKKLALTEFPMTDPSQKVGNLSLINNQIVLMESLGKENYGGNPIYIAFLELYLISPRETEIAFNKLLSQLRYWSIHPADIKGFDEWDKGFKKLASKISVDLYNRTYLNYHLLAADYYYETGNFNERRKSFDEIMKWQAKAKLNEAELLDLAQYLCYQDQFSKAIELLLPQVQKEKPNEELLYYFLQIAVYEEEKVPQAKYLDLLKKANTLYPTTFCKLFSKEKMGIQLLKRNQVKELYCEKCR